MSNSVIPWTVTCQVSLFIKFSRQEYWIGSYSLLQGIFLTQGLNPGILHHWQILYHLGHQGSSVLVLPLPKSWPPSMSQNSYSRFRSLIDRITHRQQEIISSSVPLLWEGTLPKYPQSRLVLYLSGQNCVVSHNLKPSFHSFGKWGHSDCLRLIKSYSLGRGSSFSRSTWSVVKR